ncbi:MAG: c-type cytochrome [Nannocystaceae bacterium]
MKLVFTTVFSLAALVGASVAVADDAPSEGARLAFQGGGEGIAACSSCHALNGWGTVQSHAPALAGLNAGYSAAQLRRFRDGERGHESMDPIAKAITDAQIDAVAEYYATLAKGRASEAELPAEQAAIAASLATRGDWERDIPACERCHGPGGRGVGPSFPALAGQHAFYIEAQLTSWRKGQRKGDPNGMMKAIADRLTKAEIAALAAYYASADPNPPGAAPAQAEPAAEPAAAPESANGGAR